MTVVVREDGLRSGVWTYLKLVLTGLSLRRGVEEVDRENLVKRDISIMIPLPLSKMNSPPSRWRRRRRHR